MKKSFTGGGIATLTIGAGAFLLGDISGYEAKELISTSISGMNALCNTIALASATILALLLTLLSLSTATDSDLKKEHYENVLLIARIDTVVFVVAIIVFQMLNIPITESDSLPPNWYEVIYYTSLGMSAILSGALVTVVLLLYQAVVSLILIVGIGLKDHKLLNEERKDADEDDISKN